VASTEPVRGRAPAAAPTQDADRDWVRAHQAELWRFVRALGAAPSVAEEVLQDALLAGLGQPDRAQWSRGDSRRWLRATARNLYFMSLRGRSRRQRRERVDTDLVEAFEARCETDPAWLEDLEACRDQLPPRSRRALELRYRDGLGREAIGKTLDVRPEGVKSLLQRIRTALRTCIEHRRARA